jgi:hypothetical protein
MAKTYKIKSEDKAAFLNRMEKMKSPISTSQIKDIPEEEAFEVTIEDPEQLILVKNILQQAPKINIVKENISLLEFIQEAVEQDVKKASEANAIMKWIDGKINNYTSDTKEIKFYNKPYDRIVLKYKNLEIELTELPSSDPNNRAQYIPRQNKITVFKTKITSEDKTTNIFKTKFKISAEYDRKSLFHEIIHYFDVTRQYKSDLGSIEKRLNKISSSKDVWKAYVNEPLELNTHFFERVFPGILEDIKDDKQLMSKSFPDFFKDVLNDKDFKDFYESLNDKNRKKIQKRLGVLYLELKNNPNKIKDLSKVDLENIEDEKEKVGWLSKIWNKLSS